MRRWLRRKWRRLRSAQMPKRVLETLGFESDEMDTFEDSQTGYRITHLTWMTCPWWVILLDWVLYAVFKPWDCYLGFRRHSLLSGRAWYGDSAVCWWQTGYWSLAEAGKEESRCRRFTVFRRSTT